MTQQERSLGPAPALALVAGTMLGIGIFIGPPVVASHLPHPGAFLLLWLGGGLAGLFGALSVAELGAMMPRAGGDYPYLRLAYGPGIAFAAGWLQILAIFPGSLATMAVGTATFQMPVILGSAYAWPVEALRLPMEPSTFWALAIVLGFSVLNHLGIVISGRVQVALAAIPIGVLTVVTVFVLSSTGLANMAALADRPQVAGVTMGALALGYLPVYFAYSGWNAAIYVGGEVRNPGKNLPLSLGGGTLIVILLYLLLCAGFLAIFDMSALAEAGEAGTAAGGRLFGAVGKLAITLLIFLAMLGSINGTVMTGARIPYAMAEQGHCLPAARKLSRRFGTPAVAIWMQTAITVALLATQRFEQLLNYATSAMLITGTLTVLAVIVLRRRLPQELRPYRVSAYPAPPLLYALSSVVVLGILVRQGDPSVYLAIGWFGLALIAHRIFLSRRTAPR